MKKQPAATRRFFSALGRWGIATAVIMVMLTGVVGLEEACAEEIHVVVASNFMNPAREIVKGFEAKTGHKVILIFGSTGNHDAQIRNGAPFAVFLAADEDHPRRLEEDGIAVPGNRFTYAVGRLVLWSLKPGVVDIKGEILTRGGFDHLAIANPRFAPYGRAAEQVLRHLKLWDALQGRLVRGEDIGQTYQFVHSGQAQLGLIAASQIAQHGAPVPGSSWEIPTNLYDPIEQQAVLLQDNKVARSFLTTLKSTEAKTIMRRFGYDTPPP